MEKKIVACLTVIVSLFFISTANAEVTIQIDDVVATAGSNVSVNVTATSTDGEGLTSLDLPLDFGVAGTGGQTGFSFLGATQITNFDSFTPGPNPSSAEDHLQSAINFGTPVPLSSSPVLLYSLDFSVGSSVASGTVFPIRILDNGTFDGNNTSFQVFTDGSLAASSATAFDGSITIAAVPEPASTTLVALVGIFAAVRRRR